jgi:hypothetical protein
MAVNWARTLRQNKQTEFEAEEPAHKLDKVSYLAMGATSNIYAINLEKQVGNVATVRRIHDHKHIKSLHKDPQKFDEHVHYDPLLVEKERKQVMAEMRCGGSIDLESKTPIAHKNLSKKAQKVKEGQIMFMKDTVDYGHKIEGHL